MYSCSSADDDMNSKDPEPATDANLASALGSPEASPAADDSVLMPPPSPAVDAFPPASPAAGIEKLWQDVCIYINIII